MSNEAGMYWHCHHDILVEWVYDYGKRATYIRIHKPTCEVATRLAKFQPVKGQLPEDFVQTARKWSETKLEFIAASNEATKVGEETYYTGEVYQNAVNRLTAADASCSLARREFSVQAFKYEQEIAALHNQECSDCTWDGRVLVLPGDEEKVW